MGKYKNRQRFRLLRAYVILAFMASSGHLLLVAVTARRSGDISPINPVTFLGLGYILPDWQDSVIVTVSGWLALAAALAATYWVMYHRRGAVRRIRYWNRRYTKVINSWHLSLLPRNHHQPQPATDEL
jgi:hypothetical protein